MGEVCGSQKPRALCCTRYSITLVWDPQGSDVTTDDGRTQYTLQIKDRVCGWKTIYWGFSTKHEVTGLGPEDCYHFRLKATTHLGESPWSTVLAATTKDDHVPTVSLYRAIQNGQPQLVRKILSNRPMVVDVHDHMGMSPLMRATSRGDAQMVTLLLNAGADVNTVSVGAGRSALMVACFQGHVDVAHLLRERGAHWYLRDSSGCTALHYAVDASQEETLQFAMDDGADIEAKDCQGWTPLMRGVVSESTISILQALVSRGADVNCCDRRNQTCLMQAVLSGRQDAVKLLIDAGVDLHSRNVYSNTALDMAIGRGFKDITLLLAESHRESPEGSRKKNSEAIGLL